MHECGVGFILPTGAPDTVVPDTVVQQVDAARGFECMHEGGVGVWLSMRAPAI